MATATAVVATLTMAACTDRIPIVTVEAPDGPVEVKVEIARTRKELAKGLMWRERMGRNEGMLFVFPAAEERSFWMKNTPLPLDIIFIDDSGQIVSISRNTRPYSEAPIRSDGPARYVLEVNAGFADEHRLSPGVTLELPKLEQ